MEIAYYLTVKYDQKTGILEMKNSDETLEGHLIRGAIFFFGLGHHGSVLWVAYIRGDEGMGVGRKRDTQTRLVCTLLFTLSCLYTRVDSNTRNLAFWWKYPIIRR